MSDGDAALFDTVARTWHYRAILERCMARRFERLATELARRGAPRVLAHLAEDSASDERRHVTLCGELARGFLASASAPLPQIVPTGTTIHVFGSELDQDPGLKGLTREVIALSCVVESLSAAALSLIFERARDDRVREVAHSVLRDEVSHARLGWAYLAWLRCQPSHDAGEALRGIGDWLPGVLSAVQRAELFEPEGEAQLEQGRRLERYGVLSRPLRRRAAIETLNAVVLPGLSQLGVPFQVSNDAQRR